MPKPIALCIEDMNPDPGQPRYVACVAVAGGLPGLGLDRQGGILWRSSAAPACELWVSGDERLILLRPAGAAAVRVHRGGRSLAAPFAKPVVLLDQDQLELAGRHFKLHVHGRAPAIASPTPIAESEPQEKPKHALRTAAAALALGSLLVGGCIEVRASPPKMAAPPPQQDFDDRPPTPDAGAPSSRDAAAKPDAKARVAKDKAAKRGAKSPKGTAKKTPAAKQGATKKPESSSPPPIEVRDKPPLIKLND
jgi:hypothetical protein